MTNGLYLDGSAYVLHLDAALNFPEILNIENSAPICKKLIIPIGSYNNKLSQWEDEDSDRGASAIELSKYLVQITNNSQVHQAKSEGFYYEYRYPTNEVIILDPRNHDGDSKSTGAHTIACAEHWKATIITSKSTMITDARMRGIEAYFLSPSIYTGYRTVEMPFDYISAWERYGMKALDFEEYFDEEPLQPNEFVEFIYEHDRPRNYKNVGMFNAQNGKLEHLQYFDSKLRPKGIYPRNARQAMAFEAAYAPSERVTVAVFYGNAGSGKTFISLGAALAQADIAPRQNSEKPIYQGQNSKRRQKQQRAMMPPDDEIDTRATIDEIIKPYHEIWCCPPDRMMGDKLGAVPGDRWQKLRDNLDGYSQNIKAFLEAQRNRMPGGSIMNYRDIEIHAESIMQSIHFTSAGQVNGNSFSNTIFLIDEAEFMKEAQIRTFIERIAECSKIFICGDPTQIQNPYGWYGNPLAKAIRRLAGDEQVVILKFDRADEIQRPGARIANRCWGRDK